VRYQVLWDNRPAGPDFGHEDFGPGEKRKAEARVRALRAEGKHKVSLWDTLDNPLSNMFRW
jgi:hypothetical protein